jgi:hypothetical protein
MEVKGAGALPGVEFRVPKRDAREVLMLPGSQLPGLSGSTGRLRLRLSASPSAFIQTGMLSAELSIDN